MDGVRETDKENELEYDIKQAVGEEEKKRAHADG